uniref:Retrovirus-related Pol polyprotein from transposon TNT 1-94 n=1 Tax=Tanacetum cinerariifolium TaxID=118510 RepID=A0A6L2P7Y3_TANCI|nr:hypothetical protein [Tanacetum cinerariifolium]
MALAEDNYAVSKEGARNDEWVKISMRKRDIKKPIWYLDSGCSRHMTGVKSYLHKYKEQPGPKVVFRDDSTCTTKGYGSIKCNGIVFTKFDEKRGTIFNSYKEVVMIALRTCSSKIQNNKQTGKTKSCYWYSLTYLLKDKPCSSCKKGKHHRAIFKTKNTSSIKKCLHLLHMDLFRPVTPRRKVKHRKLSCPSSKELKIKMTSKSNNSDLTMVLISRIASLSTFVIKKGFLKTSPLPTHLNKMVLMKNRTLIEAARTMLSGTVFSKQYWTEVVATACYTQNRSAIMKRHLKTPYEIFRKRISNINVLYVFECLVYIHNHKDHLGKFDEKADDGYLLGYSLVSKAFRVFNTIRQQTKETYHITFDESPDAIKFSKPSVDNINIAKNERYPPNEYLHPYERSQSYQTNSNDVSFMEPYKCPESVVLKTKVLSDQNGQADQNDHNDQFVQNDEILNDDHFEQSNHNNNE